MRRTSGRLKLVISEKIFIEMIFFLDRFFLKILQNRNETRVSLVKGSYSLPEDLLRDDFPRGVGLVFAGFLECLTSPINA